MSVKEKEFPVGFNVTKSQKDELQRWADYFYGQQSIDPQTKKAVRIIEKPQIGLLIKEAVYAFIYQYRFFLQMKENPELMQMVEKMQEQMTQ